MIVLDTHIWVWWVHGDEKLTANWKSSKPMKMGKLASAPYLCGKSLNWLKTRLELPIPLEKWFKQALSYPGIQIIELTPEIATESTRLSGEFHKDPADQIIVATARVMKCKLVTSDERILNYPHVKTIA